MIQEFNLLSLAGKTAFITGSSRGIGRAICEFFAKLDCNVIINGTREDAVNQVAQSIKSNYSVKLMTAVGDITSEPFVKESVERAIDFFGKVDILINNAGITRDNLLMRMKTNDWDSVMDVNLKAPFLFTKAFIRPMLKQKNGRIINITSVVGQTGNPGQANYCASKGGIIAFTKSVAREFAAKNITVNAVAPGFIETDMTNVMTEEQKNSILESIPQKRLGTTREVAESVAFLASDSASYITGQVLAINGGMYM